MSEQLRIDDDDFSIALRRTWERALQLLSAKVSIVTYESYLRPIHPISWNGTEVVLGAPSPFAREWIEKRYSNGIRAVLESLFEQTIKLRFVITEDPDPAPSVERRVPRRAARATPDAPSLPLNEKFTFDHFVVGDSNRLAQAGSIAVSVEPGKAYNPLFLYGPPGVGKTHLLHAIAHSCFEHKPDIRVAYVSGEHFTQHYLLALRENRTNELRRRMRGVDVWLVDDVQFIAGKTSTKEEFFHTFNTLHQSGKQIVICSDRSPRELREMDERLRSRFECGLIADIQMPEFDTRLRILKHHCKENRYDIPNEVLNELASAIQSNVRALEGALVKLVTYASVMSKPIDIELTQRILSEYLITRPASSVTITCDLVIQKVSESFGVPPDHLRSARRDTDILLARQVAIYLCREFTSCSLKSIGVAFGGRDHTTILHSIERIEQKSTLDTQLRHRIDTLRDKIRC
ncbi:MAG: chromosomal replication initiator protein DnaA [Armatimonadetes bacterium]|nr:chromosomal replication initiator protein DnaA [Armatimonadota bacterium]